MKGGRKMIKKTINNPKMLSADAELCIEMGST